MHGRGRGYRGGKGFNQSKPGIQRKDVPDIKMQNTRPADTGSRFARIKMQHSQAAKQSLEGYESSSDEEDLNEETIMTSLIKTYKSTLKENSQDPVDFAYLHESCQSGGIMCLICISTVKRQEAIWHCASCFAILHLGCIQRWVREGSARNAILSNEHFPNMDVPWYCPKCRLEYKQLDIPTRYMCHCGKMEDPEFDPWLLPHSCGDTCGRPLKPFCGHKCLLLCHPGPCPPCPKTVKVGCYCGRKPQTIRRCGSGAWSCGQKCGKMLICGKHKCQENCHDGDCPDCKYTSLQSCICGKNKKKHPCAIPVWKCDQKCEKILPCDIHSCAKVCHSGPCGDCPRSGLRSCPCGKTSISHLPCSEDIPTCDDTCGKSLDCSGHHRCTRRCHHGLCGPCPLMVEKKCRCGKRKKETPCHREYTCEVKCQRMRDCGNHQCKRKCCDGNCPKCEQVCGRSLQCKRHKCHSRCHQGPCYPCILTSRITCKCGKTGITVLCGKEKTTKPPKCKRLCNAATNCHHESRLPHNCHFGECPKCSQICNIKLNCGHACPADCHDVVLVRTQIKAAGPWELQYQCESAIKCLPCPPCKYPVPIRCLGDHEISNLPCYEARQYCCGRKCGRSLNCGNHKCSLQCHEVKEAKDDKSAGNNCDKCEEPCLKARPEGCMHACTLPCHPGPCAPCKKRVRQRCHCAMIILHHVCSEWTKASVDDKSKMESCGNNCPKMISCGHLCNLLCHKGPCLGADSCTKKKNVWCSCKRKKKEFPCNQVQRGVGVPCDDVCSRKRAELIAQEREKQQQKKTEEERIQQIELEKFDRKMHKSSKSRRSKRNTSEGEDTTPRTMFIWKCFRIGFSVLCCLILLYYGFYLVTY